MNTFTDKVIWITGASSGYGEAMAKLFAERGAKVIISARREDKLQQLVAEHPKSLLALPLDMSKPETFVDATALAIGAFGHIDIIIHNAAIAQSGSALETQADVARQIMNIDYFSHTELTRAILPHFISRKSGHIVVTSGLLARLTLPGRSSYAAAKAALFGYFGCLRAEMIEHNINVTILIPGMMHTDLVSKAIKADGEISHAPAPNAGCPVSVAAEQSLAAIANKSYEAYIGTKDKSYVLWKITQYFPNKGIKMLLDKIRTP